MHPSEIESAARLDQAFSAFNEVSQHLATSYRALELQVAALTAQLEQARGEGVSQHAENERLTTRLGHLLAVLPAGVVVLDAVGTVSEHNPAALALLGGPLGGESWSAVIRRAFDPRPSDGHEISLRDGRRVSVATQSLAPEAGQIVLITDMTGTRALQDRVRRVERLSAMGEMAAELAHQIRTPLATALLYVSQLFRPDLDPDGRTRVAEKIRERLRHLEHLINDMLVFARGGSAAAERVEIGELLEQLRSSLDGITSSTGCTLVLTGTTATVLGNREALLGALTNLCVNAIQACGAGGRIEVEAEKAAGGVEIRVRDNGPGMTPEVRARVFEPFFTTRAQGTGLGLAVVQSVVQAHRGTVDLASEPGKGSLFTLRLPLAPEAGGKT
jgi:two-component system, sensor histidine kinase FlrB